MVTIFKNVLFYFIRVVLTSFESLHRDGLCGFETFSLSRNRIRIRLKRCAAKRKKVWSHSFQYAVSIYSENQWDLRAKPGMQTRTNMHINKDVHTHMTAHRN